MEQSKDIGRRVKDAKGDAQKADQLIREYMPFIKSETYKTLGYVAADQREDELSIAMFGFYEAIESYSVIKGNFLSYASMVMKRRIIDYLRKEKRHQGQVSMDTPISDDNESTLGDSIQDSKDAYEEHDYREATKSEIEELRKELESFSLSFSDISDNCPKQERTLTACKKVLQIVRKDLELMQQIKVTGKIPMARLALESGVEKKTLERHRRYLLALILIYSNGYDLIRGHLVQVLNLK